LLKGLYCSPIKSVISKPHGKATAEGAALNAVNLGGAYWQASCDELIKIFKQAAATTLTMLQTHAA